MRASLNLASRASALALYHYYHWNHSNWKYYPCSFHELHQLLKFRSWPTCQGWVARYTLPKLPWDVCSRVKTERTSLCNYPNMNTGIYKCTVNKLALREWAQWCYMSRQASFKGALDLGRPKHLVGKLHLMIGYYFPQLSSWYCAKLWRVDISSNKTSPA